MKKILQNCFLLALSLSAQTILAQPVRYFDEVFAGVSKQSNVQYGANFYFTPPITTNPADPQQGPLVMDIYSATGDAQTSRPLVIYLHTGNFLPKYFNGGIGGAKDDSSNVEICRRLAKRGFVAASIAYRLGWNPLSTDPDVRRGTLLNAVYRAIHDAQTAVRFFKKSVAEDGNPYGVDPNKIVLMGQGSGGYVSLAYVTLDRIEEIQIEKFVDVNQQSYINTALVGNVDGTGGAVNTYNHPGYTNAVSMSINLGGALGDSSWMEAGEAPIVSFHCPDDGFAPFENGIVIVPTTAESVVPVSGSKVAVRRANQLGNQDVLRNTPFNDGYSVAANARLASNHPKLGVNPDNFEGLYPFIRPTIAFPFQETAPWEFWDSTTVVTQASAFQLNGAEIHGNAIAGNPDMSRAKAYRFIDTIIGYSSPRMIRVLELPGFETIGFSDVTSRSADVSIYPNPSTGDVYIRSGNNAGSITAVRLFDITGRMVYNRAIAPASSVTLDRNALIKGVYLLETTTAKGGNAVTKLILE